MTFDYEGTQQAQFFTDHGIAAFVVKYRLPSDQTMEDKSLGPIVAKEFWRTNRMACWAWIRDCRGVSVAVSLTPAKTGHFVSAPVFTSVRNPLSRNLLR